MLEVILALVPAVAWGIYLFGINAVKVISASVITCALAEYISCLVRRKPLTLRDFSFLVTGVLFALTLPPTLPVWIVCLGAAVSIIIGKEIFGGLGQNIFNPALVGRAFLMASFPAHLTTWVKPFDAVSCATPLGIWKFQKAFTGINELFLGTTGGCIGETSALILLLGGLYLIIRKIADWRIPLSYLGSVTLISGILYIVNNSYGSIWFHLFSGGLLLGAFFMATDPVTCPVTRKGKFIFGTGCAIITMVIRYFGGLPEGVMYSILFMNALFPLIERFTVPKPLGKK